MNYYPFHIGDYAVHTRHLSLLEDLAYRRLLDLYYSNDGVIPSETQSVSRLLGMREYQQEVETVLAEFFTKDDAGKWSHGRCDEEIAKAKAAAERARVNGLGGGRPVGSKTKQKRNPAGSGSVVGNNPAASKSKAPITQDQSQSNSEANASGADAPPKSKLTDPNEIIFGYGVPLLTSAGSTDKHARSFLGGLRKEHGDAALIGSLRECIKAKPLQPLEWLAAALPPKATGKHAGFATKDYREGVTADGSLA